MMFDYVLVSAAVCLVAALIFAARHVKGVKFYILLALTLVSFLAFINYSNQRLAETPRPKIVNPINKDAPSPVDVQKIEVVPIEEKVKKLSDENNRQNRSTVERFKNLSNKND